MATGEEQDRSSRLEEGQEGKPDAVGADNHSDLREAAALNIHEMQPPKKAGDHSNPDHPKCPHCGYDPLVVKARIFQVGRAVMMVAYCRGCRNPVPAMLLEIQQPRIAVPPGAGRIPGLD